MSSYAMDRNTWAQYDIFEQMGNIGSEVGRSIKAHRAGKAERESRAIDRALDLFDATIECLVKQQAPHRAREVILAREQFTDLFWGNAFERDADALERYFMGFARAARTNP